MTEETSKRGFKKSYDGKMEKSTTEPKEYYKLYVENTDYLAGTVEGNEALAIEWRDKLNALKLINEEITYAKIDIDEYKVLRGILKKSIVKGIENKIDSPRSAS